MHKHWEEQALMYVTHDLDTNERRQFEAHLKHCPQCQTDVDEWGRIAGATRQHFRTVPIFQRREWSRVLPFAAAVILVVVLGMILASTGLNDGGSESAHSILVQSTVTATATASEEFPPTLVLVPSMTATPTYLVTIEPRLTVSASPLPTMTATPMPTPTPIRITTVDMIIGPSSDFPSPSSFHLDNDRLQVELQGWNNQGVAALVMGLGYYGAEWSQEAIAEFIHPVPDDPVVNAPEMVDFVNTEVDGISALSRVNGNPYLLKRLLVAGYPIIIQNGLVASDSDWYGHYRLVVGYDADNFYVYDSYLGQGQGPEGLAIANEDFLESWWQFSNTFMVLYPSELESSVLTILELMADPAFAYQSLIRDAQTRLFEDDDAWTRYNIGDAFSALGEYEIAAGYFQSFSLTEDLPYRALWYRHAPFEAFYQTGDVEALSNLLDVGFRVNNNVGEWHYYQGMMYVADDDRMRAIVEFQTAVSINPFYEEAQAMLDELMGEE